MPTAPLSNYLKMYRKRSGLSQPELAYLLGCSHGSKISRYERGERCPSLDALIAYEAIFCGSTKELFSGRREDVVRSLLRRADALRKRLLQSSLATPSLQRKVAFLNELRGVMPTRRP